MRSAETYRAARRSAARVIAASMSDSFTLTWQNGGFRHLPKDAEKYLPRRITGKTYAPNGKRECARRLRHIGLMIVHSDGFWRTAS